MIIFGSRTSSKIVAMLVFVCGACGREAAQRLVRRRTWFTLFFTPIFPFGHGTYAISCAYCGAHSPITRENADRFVKDSEAAQINAEADRILAAEDARIAAEQNGQGQPPLQG
ncbi:zinc ribbon domain-containing protein [Frondihabitans australicus]|uniref:Zinc ribbon family protein n=1 Tax=Frondihabitans australicus TaxID=386892 RepID=A0A495IDX7_9MICO|nr:zinc ribbon domain-containing protein [Frondihabitans australicus]RKR74213.1 zinc ribbon family protein [Frondihabitans australicus]